MEESQGRSPEAGADAEVLEGGALLTGLPLWLAELAFLCHPVPRPDHQAKQYPTDLPTG